MLVISTYEFRPGYWWRVLLLIIHNLICNSWCWWFWSSWAFCWIIINVFLWWWHESIRMGMNLCHSGIRKDNKTLLHSLCLLSSLTGCLLSITLICSFLHRSDFDWTAQNSGLEAQPAGAVETEPLCVLFHSRCKCKISMWLLQTQTSRGRRRVSLQ